MQRELFRLDEISVRGLCLDLLKNLWMILLGAAAVWMAATGIHNMIYDPAYTSSATLVVTEKGENSTYASLSTAASMADVFGQVFQSEALRDRIISDVGEEIEGSISCVPISETNLLVLSVTSPDPRQAYLFINSALTHYEDVASDVFSNAALQIVQEPEVPEFPSNTSWFLAHRNLLTVLGAVGAAAVIMLFYLLRMTVKNAAAAERQLDGKVRGVIPYEKKEQGEGIRDLLDVRKEKEKRNREARKKNRVKSAPERKKGKEALLNTLSNLFDQKYEELSATIEPGMSVYDKLLFLNHELFFMIENSVDLHLLAYLYSSQLITKDKKSLSDKKRFYFQWLTQLIQEGLDSGEFADTSTAAELMDIYAMYERALLYDWALFKGKFSLTARSDKLLPHVLDTFRQGV